jgi:hypothetical protein
MRRDRGATSLLFDGRNQMACITLPARVGFDKHTGQPGRKIRALIQIMRD